ncbi:glycoside hydrolase family 95 protein [Pontiellaceae bacterium B12227]|nr:glycoside hydrolase family 95 protein [Pontiellaceae bacterium B12227]
MLKKKANMYTKSTFSYLLTGVIALTGLTSEAAPQKKKPNKFNYREAAQVQPLNVPPESELSLWYNQPATHWEEALPVGNGRLGAMVYGGASKELIQLNEDTIWAGPPIPEVKENISETVEKVRELLFAGKYAEAQELQQSVMAPRISPRSYQTMGELHFDFGFEGNATNFRRDLNLDTAIATTTYTVQGVTYTREVTSSPVDQVITVHITADKPGSVAFSAWIERDGMFEVAAEGSDTLVARGQAAQGNKHLGVKFATVYKMAAQNGTTRIEDNKLVVDAADSATLYIAAATDYHAADTANPLTHDLVAISKSKAAAAMSKSYAQMKDASIASHQELFRRVSLKLGTPSKKSTLERLQGYKKGIIDPDFEALFFQYGRYLLITSSREGSMPANLQGLWCKDMAAPWNSDYHININMQMNYWPAEIANLSECHLPFMDYIERLVPSGKKTAKDLYSCNGFLAGHASDVWHGTVPFGKAQYGQWVVGGAWCTAHFMEHYRFTQDETFLKERTYPILKESALFFLDWLVADPETGKLVSGPSTSPENKFIVPGITDEAVLNALKEYDAGKKTKKEIEKLLGSKGLYSNLTMGPSMDQQIIWEVFSNTLEAARILGIDDAFTKDVEKALANLALPQVGSDGRLMEWTKEFGEVDPGHRHISHLYALFPGHQYNMNNSPEMVAAARNSIDGRLAKGGGGTGWSRAWIINFWARFKNVEKAHWNLEMLFSKSTYNNLFDKHAPFQIDGNFGGAAGIVEMLIQSHAGEIELLPCLPKAWPDGEVKGLRARGGFEIDFQWAKGEVTDFKIRRADGLAPATAKLKVNGETRMVEAK